MSRRSPLLATGTVGYAERAKTALVSPSTGKQIKVYSFSVQNRAGAAADLGLAVKFPNSWWKFGTITAASTPDFLDATSAIQAGTAQTIFTTTNNDGFLVQAKKKFNLIGLTVSNTATGGTIAYDYYNGSSYTTLTTISVPVYTSAADIMIAFAAPVDWAVGTHADVGGDTSMYSIRVRATTAPGDSGQANAVWVGQLLAYREGVADNSGLTLSFDEQNPLVLETSESLMPYFGTANANNTTEAFYAISD